MTNTGLQEFARPWARVSWPWLFFQHRILSPSTVIFPVQLKVSVRAAAPQSSAAAQVKILKVEPGSYTSETAVMRMSSCNTATSSRGGELGS